MKPIFLLFILLWVVGCSTPPAAGVPTAFADLCTEENRDKRVAVTGFLRLPGMMALVTDTILLDFYESPDGEGEKISASVPVGEGANEVEDLPDDYTDADLKVRTNANDVIGIDDEVTISGELYYGAAEPRVCFLTGDLLIERAAP